MTVHLNDVSEDIERASAPVGLVNYGWRRGIYRNYLKRALDLATVIAASVVIVPVVAILAMLVMLDGHAPFYLSDRVGRGGKNFRMIKLRSMRPDADRQLEHYLRDNPQARAEWDSKQKLLRDPRVTFVGGWMRRRSLDELPQLWNVFVGDMSIVGPRPMLPAQRPLYPGLAYYALRPGLTGPWQVSDRNDTTFARRADFDTAYEADIRLRTDLGYVLRTFSAVMRGTGV